MRLEGHPYLGLIERYGMPFIGAFPSDPDTTMLPGACIWINTSVAAPNDIRIFDGTTKRALHSGLTVTAIKESAGAAMPLDISAAYGPYVDDWVTGSTSGETNWTPFNVGTGALIALAPASASAQHPGVVSLASGVLINGYAGLHKSADSIFFSGGTWAFECVISIGANLADAVDDYSVWLGFGDDIAGADHVDGAYWQYDRATDATHWLMCTAKNSTRTKTASSLVAAASTFVRLGLVVNAAASSVDFFVDGVSEGVVATNIPGSARALGIVLKIVKSLGVNDRNVLVDAVGVGGAFTAAR